MSKIHPIQTSFAAGEISPFLYGRIDSDIYKTGLKHCENFDIDIRGSLSARAGTQHQFEFENNSDAKLWAFNTDLANTAILVFLDGRLQIRKVINPDVTKVEFLTDPSFLEDGQEWIEVAGPSASVVYIDHKANLISGALGSGYAQISQSFTGVAGTYRFGISGSALGNTTTGLHIQIGTGIGDGTYLDETILGGALSVFEHITIPATTVFLTIRQLGGDSHTSIIDYLTFGAFNVEGNFVLNGDFHEEGDDWTEDDPGTGTIEYETGDHDHAILTNGVSDHVALSQIITLPAIGLYSFSIDGHALGGTVAGNEFTVKIGTAAGLSDLYLREFSGQSYIAEQVDCSATTVYLTLTQEDNGTDIHESIINSVFLGVSEYTYIVLDDDTSPYTPEEFHTMHFNMSPEGDICVITCPTQQPYEVVFTRSTGVYTFNIIAFTYDDGTPAVASPPEWATSPPGTMCFIQGRAWWGGSLLYPDTIWGSESGVYYTVGDGSGTLAAEPVKFSTSRHGLIKWLTGGKTLIAGTEMHEFTIWSGRTTDSLIQAGHIDTVRQTSHGSSVIQPVDVGNAIVFASTNQEILRAFWFNWQEDGWISQDLTFASNHITKEKIVELRTTKTPNDIIFCVLENGQVAQNTYYRDGADQQAQAGWSLQTVADGSIKSIAIFEQKENTQMWAAVARVVEGVSYIHIEKMVVGQEDVIDLPVFMTDSSKQVIYGNAEDYMEGLGHLEGKWVRPVVDNAVHPLVEVEFGRIDLQWSGHIIKAGLPYSAHLETLPLSIVDPYNATLGHMKRWNKIYVYINASVKPLINGVRPATRLPSTPMDETQPDETQIVEVNNLGRRQLETITIEHDLPRRLNILSIFGELGQDSL